MRPFVQATQAGVVIARHDHKFATHKQSAGQFAPHPTHFVVDVHGTADKLMAGGRDDLSIKDTADVVRAAGWDGKQPILLVGCQTGAKANGVAAQLSRELGGEVTAPTKDAWVDDRGNLFASSSQHDPRRDFRPGWPPNGEWATFKPDGTASPHTQSSPPGHTPDWRDVGENGPSRAFRRGEFPPEFGADPGAHKPSIADRMDGRTRAPVHSGPVEGQPDQPANADQRQPRPLAPLDAPLFFQNRPDFRAAPQDMARMRQEYPPGMWERDSEKIDQILARNPHLRHIPRDELIALRGYTANHSFDTINTAFRENDIATLRQHEAQIRCVSSALNKMPIHNGVVTRVLRTRFPELRAALYKKDTIVTERAFTSCSGPRATKSFPGQVKLYIKSYTGRDVSALSHTPTEQEVLFGPGTRFRVTGTGVDPATGTHHIQLEEVPPPRPQTLPQQPPSQSGLPYQGQAQQHWQAQQQPYQQHQPQQQPSGQHQQPEPRRPEPSDARYPQQQDARHPQHADTRNLHQQPAAQQSQQQQPSGQHPQQPQADTRRPQQHADTQQQQPDVRHQQQQRPHQQQAPSQQEQPYQQQVQQQRPSPAAMRPETLRVTGYLDSGPPPGQAHHANFGPNPQAAQQFSGHPQALHQPSHLEQSNPTQPLHRPDRPTPVHTPPTHQPSNQNPPVVQRHESPTRDLDKVFRDLTTGEADSSRQRPSQDWVDHPADREVRPRSGKPLGERLGELTDERLDRLRPNMVATEAGMSVFDASEKNHHFTGKAIRPIPGYFVVDMHGTSNGVRVGRMNLGDADIAEILRANPDWDGKTPILLTGCGSGKDENSVAARLAKRLGVEVTAPRSDAWADYRGNLFSAQSEPEPGEPRPKWPPNGEWTRFNANGTPLPPDGSPYPPGHRPSWGDHTPAEAPPSATQRGDDSPPPPQEPRYTFADVARYLDRPEVQAALKTTAVIEVKVGDHKVELPVRDVITARLGNHPELVQVIERTGYLERSLLHTPKTLASLLVHPEAIPHLIKAVQDVETRGPDEINNEFAENPKARGPEVSETQRTASQEVANRVISPKTLNLHQPGFEAIQGRTGDEQAVRQFLDGMYETGRPAQEALMAIVDPIARDLNGTAGHRNPENLKDPERAMQKIANDYGGDPSQLVDLVGSMIVFDRLDQIYDALPAIRKKAVIRDGSGFEIVRYKDRFQKPQGSGYCDILMNVRLPNGHIGEFRLHLRKVDDVAKWDHALYEVRRDLESIATHEKRAMSAYEEALENAIILRQRTLYQNALKEPEGGSE